MNGDTFVFEIHKMGLRTYQHPLIFGDKRVPVKPPWLFLRLRMEERVRIWWVAANVLNKHLRTADKGWSSILSVGRGANNSLIPISLLNVHTENLGSGLMIWYELSNGKVTLDFFRNKNNIDTVMKWSETCWKLRRCFEDAGRRDIVWKHKRYGGIAANGRDAVRGIKETERCGTDCRHNKDVICLKMHYRQ